MARKRYLVRLDEAVKGRLSTMIRRGNCSARKLARARILLKASDGWDDETIAQAVDVSVDESPKQLLADTRDPLPPAPGRPARQDHEYKRNGMQEVFVCCEPKTGQRHLEVKAQRTTTDFAHFMKRVADEFYPDAQCIRVVLDNLNTHKLGAFYENFEPDEARRLAKRFEFHYTPKHGSWLNMAEIELTVLSKVCLERRIPDPSRLKQEVAVYERKRNQARATIDWRFTTPDARQKMRRVYPLNSSG